VQKYRSGWNETAAHRSNTFHDHWRFDEGFPRKVAGYSWRKRVRVEHTRDTSGAPRTGFEDREDHRTPCASACVPMIAATESSHSDSWQAENPSLYFSRNRALAQQHLAKLTVLFIWKA